MEKTKLLETVRSLRVGDIVHCKSLDQTAVGVVVNTFLDGAVVLMTDMETWFVGIAAIDSEIVKEITVLEKDNHGNRTALINRVMKEAVEYAQKEEQQEEACAG